MSFKSSLKLDSFEAHLFNKPQGITVKVGDLVDSVSGEGVAANVEWLKNSANDLCRE